MVASTNHAVHAATPNVFVACLQAAITAIIIAVIIAVIVAAKSVAYNYSYNYSGHKLITVLLTD
jgi:hypothetical protein